MEKFKYQDCKLTENRINSSELVDVRYRHRVMKGLIAILIVLIATVRYWPVEEKSTPEMAEIQFQEQPLIDDTQITRQNSSPPPPPVPRPPQPVPDDEIVFEDLEIDDSLDLDEFPELPEESGSGLRGEDDVIVSEPQLPPTVIKIVEPHVPELPLELKGRIEMIVNFLVDSKGQVEEVSIVQIRRYDENLEEYEVLPFIRYGLIDATLEAAMLWQFRPARDQGAEVKTYTSHRFNY